MIDERDISFVLLLKVVVVYGRKILEKAIFGFCSTCAH